MPKILKILIDPNPILSKKSAEINLKKISSKELKTLCDDMVKTMLVADGVGLAAPQIGKNIRLIALNTSDGQICMINPEIIKKSWSREWGEEGCLSVPGIYGEVKRHKKISCRYLNSKGEQVKIEAEGLFARVIQHETDHLDGILFIDKMKKGKTQITASKHSADQVITGKQSLK